MDLGFDIQAIDFATRIAIATVCALAGITLLWLDRQRGRVPSRPSALATAPRLAPIAAPAQPRNEIGRPKLTTEAAYDRLRARIAEAGSKTQRMNSCQQGAARQLDTAEVALRRLIDEISGVMPVALSPALVPRRPMPIVAKPVAPQMAAAAA